MVVVIGASGLLGSELVSTAPCDITALTHKDIEISDYRRSWKLLSDIHPDLIINAAGYTNVDKCEEDPQPALTANMVGPWYLSKMCRHLNCGFVQFSSDFVFDGKKGGPYLEDDKVFPLSWYGNSKVYSEHVARKVPRHYTIRTGELYGKGGLGKKQDMVDTIVKAARVGWGNVRLIYDQFVSPTWTRELAKATWRLVEVAEPGTYHLTSEWYCSWHEFGQTILNILGIQGEVPRVSLAEFSKGRAERPVFSVLENTKAKQHGIFLPHWRESIQKYLEKNHD